MLFYCLFQYFEEKEYQTESKRNETFGIVIFLEEYHPGGLEIKSEDPRGAQEIGGAPLQGAAPCLVDPSSTPRPTSFSYITLRTLKPSEIKVDREFRCRKPL